jgi:tryptophanyl-tRNA synthetase
MSKRRVLTGIKPTGSPHLGNYVGAIRPAIASSRDADVDSFFFLADYHALIGSPSPELVQSATLEIAASWLALGLDPERVTFYRQSDIPEIPELTWLLTCVTGKGLLNRAHAYKAAVDANAAEGADADAGVTAGLYMYPVLMAADILMFNAHEVPVGRDQVQHIEIARDLGQRFNHVYGGEHFVLPEARVDDNTATLAGLDGRKMSKSYNNTIQLWSPPAKLREQVMSIKTNLLAPGEAKDPSDSNVFSIYQAFASDAEAAAMRQAFADGIGWGDAKQTLFERVDRDLAPARERYRHFMDHPAEVETLLLRGAERAREVSRPFIAQLRAAAGLRSVATSTKAAGTDAVAAPAFQPELKQYREADGRFYFKLAEKQRGVLAQSIAFANGRDAGAAITAIRQGRVTLAGQVLQVDGVEVAQLADGADGSMVQIVLALLRAQEQEAQAKKAAAP